MQKFRGQCARRKAEVVVGEVVVLAVFIALFLGYHFIRYGGS